MDSDLMTGFLAGQADSNNNGGNGMFGDGWAGIWGIIILAMVFGWGNGGWGGLGGGTNGAGLQGALTRGDLCSEFAFNDLQNAVRGVQQGICDSTFALNNNITAGFTNMGNAICNLGYEQAQLTNGVNMNMLQGFNAANIVALQNQNALQTQLADCCCTTQRTLERGFADTNYNMATQACALQTSIANSTRDIIDSQQAGTRAVLDWLCAKETADLRSENQSLKLAASQQAQNNYLVSQLRPCPQPAYLTCNPFTGTYGGYPGYGNAYNGCGCNTGCSGCGC